MGPRAARRWAALGLSEVLLLRRAVVARGLLQLLDVRRGELRPVDLQRELVEFAGEAERHLVIIGYRRAGVRPDVKVLVPLQDQRKSTVHGLARHLLAIHFEQPVPPRPMPLRSLNASVAIPSPSYLK